MKLSKRMRGKTGWDEPITDEQVEDWADEVEELEEDKRKLRLIAKMAQDYLTKYGPHGVTDMPQHLAVVEVLRVALLKEESSNA